MDTTKRLTKVQKRLLVLKDALKQIKIGFLKPAHTGVCTLPAFDPDDSDAKLLLKTFRRKKKTCKVCARGSLLLSTVLRFNNYTTDQLRTSDKAISFSRKHRRPKARLIAILQNAIKNKGIFTL